MGFTCMSKIIGSPDPRPSFESLLKLVARVILIALLIVFFVKSWRLNGHSHKLEWYPGYRFSPWMPCENLRATSLICYPSESGSLLLHDWLFRTTRKTTSRLLTDYLTFFATSTHALLLPTKCGRHVIIIILKNCNGQSKQTPAATCIRWFILERKYVLYTPETKQMLYRQWLIDTLRCLSLVYPDHHHL